MGVAAKRHNGRELAHREKRRPFLHLFENRRGFWNHIMMSQATPRFVLAQQEAPKMSRGSLFFKTQMPGSKITPQHLIRFRTANMAFWSEQRDERKEKGNAVGLFQIQTKEKGLCQTDTLRGQIPLVRIRNASFANTLNLCETPSLKKTYDRNNVEKMTGWTKTLSPFFSSPLWLLLCACAAPVRPPRSHWR